MISIIIPAHNEEKYIEKTINAIKNQNYKNYEIIVSCNACSDKTYNLAKKHTKKVLNLKQKGVSFARNQGAKIAKGDLFIFLDADTLLEKNTLTKIKEISSLKKVVGTCKAKPDNKRIIAKIFMSTKNLFWFASWVNGIIFCNKEVYKKTKGFNENLTKKETSKFIKQAKKHAKYVLAKTYVTNSMRRFEKKGYLTNPLFWIKETLFPTKKEYETIR